MARPKKRIIKNANSRVRVERTTATPTRSSSFNWDLQNNRSLVNLILGAAVLIVLGIVLFNFLINKNQNSADNLGPSQQTENTQNQQGDVAKENLPGKYTVKEGDTLFAVAQKYYDNGYKYDQLVKANNITNENSLQVGQVLEIPKLEAQVAQASPATSTAPQDSTVPTATPASSDQAMNQNQTNQANQNLGTGGDPNQTVWGPRINANTYTVTEGDWLSKIAGRAYGDVMAYQKLSQANNLSNPDLIEPGTVLKIPR